jgi:hypothetical protein
VKILGPARLIEAFSEWGLNEERGRLRRRDPAGESVAESLLRGANTALSYRSPLVARILLAGPDEHCVRVEILFGEAPTLHIANGLRLEAWTDTMLADLGDAGVYVRKLVASSAPVQGSLICTARSSGGGLQPPIVIFDGWHRAAAWVEHGRRGNVYAVVAYIIITQQMPQLLGPLQP